MRDRSTPRSSSLDALLRSLPREEPPAELLPGVLARLAQDAVGEGKARPARLADRWRPWRLTGAALALAMLAAIQIPDIVTAFRVLPGLAAGTAGEAIALAMVKGLGSLVTVAGAFEEIYQQGVLSLTKEPVALLMAAAVILAGEIYLFRRAQRTT